MCVTTSFECAMKLSVSAWGNTIHLPLWKLHTYGITFEIRSSNMYELALGTNKNKIEPTRQQLARASKGGNNQQCLIVETRRIKIVSNQSKHPSLWLCLMKKRTKKCLLKEMLTSEVRGIPPSTWSSKGNYPSLRQFRKFAMIQDNARTCSS